MQRKQGRGAANQFAAGALARMALDKDGIAQNADVWDVEARQVSAPASPPPCAISTDSLRLVGYRCAGVRGLLLPRSRPSSDLSPPLIPLVP